MYYMYNSKLIIFAILLLVAITIYSGIKKSKAGVKAGVFSIVAISIWYVWKILSFKFAIMKFRFMWQLDRVTYNMSFLLYVVVIFVVLYVLFKIFGKK